MIQRLFLSAAALPFHSHGRHLSWWKRIARFATLAVTMSLTCSAARHASAQASDDWESPESLPSSELVPRRDSLGDENRDRVEDYLDRLIEERTQLRHARWLESLRQNDETLEAWKRQQRESIRYVLGDRDPIVESPAFLTQSELGESAVVARGELGQATWVRWRVFEDVVAAGLLLEPIDTAVADVILVGAAGESPFAIANFESSLPTAAVAKRLLASRCRVLIPHGVSRGNEASGNPAVKRLSTSHREFLWRLSFFMGRHPWGCELATHQAAIKALRGSADPTRPLGLVGFADGGDSVLHLAALTDEAKAVWIAGSFGSREEAHREPIDRCVYDQVNRFGAAELVALSKCKVLIEAASRPDVVRPVPIPGSDDAGTGELHTLAIAEVTAEWNRTLLLLEASERVESRSRVQFVASQEGIGDWGSSEAVSAFSEMLGLAPSAEVSSANWNEFAAVDETAEQVAWIEQWIAHSGRLANESRSKREVFWREADASSIESWKQSTNRYRDELRRSVIGELPPPIGELNLQSCLIDREATWSSYEVVMQVGDGMIMTGVMVVPNEAMQQWQTSLEAPSEQASRSPVVVMQHGRNGKPYLLCDSDAHEDSYHAVGARLAERGYIVFAPQHLYLGEEAYRVVQRKCFALGMTMFAPMVRQHERLLEWLHQLPMVDSDRISFYGKSYGGKSAMLIPAVLEGYTTSICSADFNEQVWKHTGLDHAFCFPFTIEYEHTEFDFADRFNYAEIAGLIAPRRFMVERGHDDGVSLDSWVAFEYAPVRRLYQRLGIPERTRIEFFDGGHEIHGVGTFEFLDQQGREER